MASVTKIAVAFIAPQQKELQRLYNYLLTCNTSISKYLNIDLAHITIPKGFKDNLERYKVKITQLKPIQPESNRGKYKFSFLCKFERSMAHPTMTDLDSVFHSIAPDTKYYVMLENDEEELYVNTDPRHQFLPNYFKLIRTNTDTNQTDVMYFNSIKNMNRYIIQSYPGINLSPESSLDATFDRFAHYLMKHYHRRYPMIQISIFVYDAKIHPRYTLLLTDEPTE